MIVVGVLGGLDSVVLLYLFVIFVFEMRDKFVVVYIDYGFCDRFVVDVDIVCYNV